MASDAVERAAAWLRARDDDLVEMTCELIRTPSDNPPGDCRAAADVVENWCDRLGVAWQRLEVAPSAGPPLPIVIAWIGQRTTTPELLLNAHLDASPGTPEWTVSPYAGEVIDGQLYGRGATLAKSDVAGYLFALAAARSVVGEDHGGAALAVTADEGSGGDHGPRYVVEELGFRPRRAMTAGFTHRVCVAHNGAIQLRIAIRGQAAHQAVVPIEREAMRDAITLAGVLLDEDRRLREIHGSIPGIEHPTLNITRLSGGELLGLAPGSVEMLVDRRVMPTEDGELVLSELRASIDRFASTRQTAIAVDVRMHARPLRPTDASREWAAVVQAEAEAVLGESVIIGGVPLYTDARWFGDAGSPTVMYGAGGEDLVDAGMNGVDEHVSVADLSAAAETVARVTTRVLTGLAGG